MNVANKQITYLLTYLLSLQIYATIGAFYLPLTVMIVIYGRIYLVSSRITRDEALSMPSFDSRLLLQRQQSEPPPAVMTRDTNNQLLLPLSNSVTEQSRKSSMVTNGSLTPTERRDNNVAGMRPASKGLLLTERSVLLLGHGHNAQSAVSLPTAQTCNITL